TAIVSQPDGKILAAGSSLDRSGSGNNTPLIRLNADGTPDPTFHPPTFPKEAVVGTLFSVVLLQPDGKIFMIGSFDSVNGTNRASIARFYADGTLDLSFQAEVEPVINNG